MIRPPVAGHDILLASNIDTDAGTMPAAVEGVDHHRPGKAHGVGEL